jgi:2'-5' RNA ligase
MLYTLGYPSIPESAKAFLEAFRRAHDVPYRDVVAAHFTMVFGCKDVAVETYLQHIGSVASQTEPIPFHCRYAMLGNDAEEECAYVFLVPDEGYSGISLLHDRLYTGVLAPYLRLDVPFIPHITLGTLAVREEAKHLCDELNAGQLSIAGILDTLTVGSLEDGKIRNVASFELGR